MYYYNQHGYTRFASVDLTANLPRYTILSRVSFPSAVGGFGIMNIWPRSIKVIPRSMQLNSVFR